MVNLILYIFFSILMKKFSACFKYPLLGKISLDAISALSHKQFKSNWVLSSKKGFFLFNLISKRLF